jgi:quinol monooxygenase YgiN
VLDGKVKLVNALPVAGYLTRPDNTDRNDYQNEYIRCGELKVKSGEIDSVIATIKDETSSFLSAEPEILSFLAFQSLEEADTIITWERYTSKSAFDEGMKKGGGYAKLMENINSLVETEEVAAYRAVGGYLSRDK